jgi:Sulfotransferase domain
VSRVANESEGGVSDRLANLLLAGVGKAGTTSLYWYLSQHPGICRSTVKETRFFLPLSAVDADSSGRLPPLSQYAEYFSKCHGEQFRMEATPHYFHGGQPLIHALRETLPAPRVVLIFREQVARAISTYRFAKSMLLVPTDETFERFVDRAIAIQRAGDRQVKATRPYWSVVSGGDYAKHLRPWLSAFTASELKILFFDDLVRSPQEMTRELCVWLGLDAEPTANFRYEAENRSVLFRRQWLQRIALSANSERLFRNHPRAKRPLRAIYYAINGTKAQAGEIDPASVSQLQREFIESNATLAAMLLEYGCRSLPGWLEPQHVRPS